MVALVMVVNTGREYMSTLVRNVPFLPSIEMSP
jgi:hypothetical protein